MTPELVEASVYVFVLHTQYSVLQAILAKITSDCARQAPYSLMSPPPSLTRASSLSWHAQASCIVNERSRSQSDHVGSTFGVIHSGDMPHYPPSEELPGPHLLHTSNEIAALLTPR
jgi:hypothetical protein